MRAAWSAGLLISLASPGFGQAKPPGPKGPKSPPSPTAPTAPTAPPDADGTARDGGASGVLAPGVLIDVGVRLAWSATLAAPPASGAVASQGRVFVATTDGFLVALDAQTGAVIYRATIGDVAVGPVLVRGSRLILATASGEVLALGAADGRTVATARMTAPIIAPPSLSGDAVVIRSSVGVYVLNADDLSVERSVGDAAFVLPGTRSRHALLSDGMLLVHGDTGPVRAWAEGSSTPAWTVGRGFASPTMEPLLIDLPGVAEPRSATVAPPARALVVGGVASGVQAIDPKTGETLWRAANGTTPVGAAVGPGSTLWVACQDRRLLRLGSDGRALSTTVLAGVPVGFPEGALGQDLAVPLQRGITELLSGATMVRMDLVNHRGEVVLPVATTPGAAFLALRERVVFSLRL